MCRVIVRNDSREQPSSSAITQPVGLPGGTRHAGSVGVLTHLGENHKLCLPLLTSSGGNMLFQHNRAGIRS